MAPMTDASMAPWTLKMYSVEKLPDLDLFRYHLCQQRLERAQKTCVFGAFFELFADTGAKERGPELGPSLTNMCLEQGFTEENRGPQHVRAYTFL